MVLFITIYKHMISTTIFFFKSLLGSKACHYSVIYYTDSVAEDICFFHGMCRKYHSSVAFFYFLEDCPQLSSRFWIKTCCWLIKEDDLWVGH